ncbi:peptidoglycan-binding protein [Streptomyces microflavus]|uniref:peptidoglycan-binding domain-containing protein n=1 Tax=Streptomyces microflavus TaxID=1919 RepID=UPI0037F9EA5F
MLGTNSWKAMQRFLATWPDQPLPYKGDIDGMVGPKTIASLQANLKKFNGYTGDIDGIAGPGTEAAFRRKAYSNPPV